MATLSTIIWSSDGIDPSNISFAALYHTGGFFKHKSGAFLRRPIG